MMLRSEPSSERASDQHERTGNKRTWNWEYKQNHTERDNKR
jgi:hypothetical protein